MTDSQNATPEFAIGYLYVKDCSFEAPVPMHRLKADWEPRADITMDHQHELAEDGTYDVTLRVTVNVSLEDTTAFVVEVHQSGSFVLSNFTDAQRDQLLKSYCPSVLLPYARQQVSEMVTQGGFPPLYLSPVDFEASYHAEQTAESA